MLSDCAVGREDEVTPQQQLGDYLQYINSPNINRESCTVGSVTCMERFNKLGRLFSRVLCTPATSAPVERVFSQSGLILRPHRARMSDSMLETLVFLKCNNDML